MSQKHTPGPWSTAATSLEQIQIVTVDPIRDEPNGLVATINRVAWCNEGEDRANARLIAAAPELLESLRLVMPWLGKMIADGGHKQCVLPNAAVQALRQAEAAIAKAQSL